MTLLQNKTFTFSKAVLQTVINIEALQDNKFSFIVFYNLEEVNKVNETLCEWQSNKVAEWKSGRKF